MTPLDPIDVRELAEGQDLEVKRAAGRDGRGECPQSFFQTYSAMANCGGGVIILGIEEYEPRRFEATGIVDVDKVRSELWSSLNNPQRVNANLLSESSVDVIEVETKRVIRVRVPRAQRTQRPIYIGTNPLTGTYRRNFDGDFRCDEETVQRMLAERLDVSRDARVLAGFDTSDLDPESLEAYRNRLRSTRPGHPWLDQSPDELLRLLGARGRDRETGAEGLTLAGLLMFGRLRSILDGVPYYVIDYQERPEPRTEPRWVDRLTTDGTWSGNLFDFHRRVMGRLTADLKVPFRLEGSTRLDETIVHEALREALTNTLIHADYSGRVPLLVVKRPDMFGFRNPGVMRLPVEEAVRGGVSDCRNRGLQKMFQLVGLGEQAGSGLPKIFRAWREESWRAPDLQERYDLEQTTLAMPMVSLLPVEAVDELKHRFAGEFDRLDRAARLALVTAAVEGLVTNLRLQEMTSEHPRDLTLMLGGLVRKGMLEPEGATRGTTYHLPDRPGRGLQGRLFELDSDCSDRSGEGSEHWGRNSEHLSAGSEHLARGADPGLAPGPSPARDPALLAAAEAVRSTGKAPRSLVESTIMTLCELRFLTITELATLLGRAHETVRVHYVMPMVRRGQLALRYPGQLNHPRQAYRKAGEV